MSEFINKLEKIDLFIRDTEKWMSAIGLLLITLLILAGVFLRTVFSFSFNWLEEFCQYLMVWIVCLGAILSVKNNEHVGVDVIFSIIPKKYHLAYRVILATICVLFLLYFTKYSIDITQRVQSTGQVSIAMPWLQMYILYFGFVVGNILLLYEYVKLLVKLTTQIVSGRKNNDISV